MNPTLRLHPKIFYCCNILSPVEKLTSSLTKKPKSDAIGPSTEDEIDLYSYDKDHSSKKGSSDLSLSFQGKRFVVILSFCNSTAL